MSTTSVAKMFTKSKKALRKHVPGILTGIGIAGMLSTTVLAVKATPKAIKLIEERKAELNVEKLPVEETVKTTWRCYVPAAATCAASVACLVGSTSVSARRNAAIAAACKLSETALADYKDAVAEAIGEDEEREVSKKAVEKAIERNPVASSEVHASQRGETLCYDPYSGRYFMSDPETIRAAINTLNDRMNRQDYVSLSEYYNEINLPHTELSDDMGWSRERGLLEYDPVPRYGEDDKLCLAILLGDNPRYEYDTFA